MITLPNDLAFPLSQDLKTKNNFPIDFANGLTKRELFAYGAMQGMLANPELYKTACKNIDPNRMADFYSLCAVEHADALIAALNQSQPKTDNNG